MQYNKFWTRNQSQNVFGCKRIHVKTEHGKQDNKVVCQAKKQVNNVVFQAQKQDNNVVCQAQKRDNNVACQAQTYQRFVV